MGVTLSGNAQHDSTVMRLEAIRQSNEQAAVTLAGQPWSSYQESVTPIGPAIKTNQIQFFRGCLASAQANGVSASIYLQALAQLGSGPA
jgi:hypothetical protein